MRVLVIDGLGGGLGKAIIEQLKAELADAELIAVGTNALATAAMLKAGAHYGATGENAVIYNSGQADYIIGALGIVFANAMHGEISPAMAAAISGSQAHKILLPIDRCHVTVLGLAEKPVSAYLGELTRKLKQDSLATGS